MNQSQLLYQPPFADKTSPFLARGSIYAGQLAYLDASVPGGSAALLKAMDHPAVRAFYRQKFDPAAMYDALYLPLGGQYAAARAGTSLEALVTESAMWQANRDLGRGGRILLRSVAPFAVLEHTPKFWAQFFSFGVPSVRRANETHVELTVKECPQVLSPWMLPYFAAYMYGSLRHCGTVQCTVVPSVEAATTMKGSLKQATFRFAISWTAGAK
jgi:hypothetical protein